MKWVLCYIIIDGVYHSQWQGNAGGGINQIRIHTPTHPSLATEFEFDLSICLANRAQDYYWRQSTLRTHKDFRSFDRRASEKTKEREGEERVRGFNSLWFGFGLFNSRENGKKRKRKKANER